MPDLTGRCSKNYKIIFNKVEHAQQYFRHQKYKIIMVWHLALLNT